MTVEGEGIFAGLTMKPRKVAILRASRIGDFLLGVPALRAIRQAWPRAEIVLLGLPRVEWVARRCRYVDRFEPFPGFPGIADQFYAPGRALAFLTRMQAETFDLAVQMHGSGAYSNIFVSLLGARCTVGFCRPRETLPWMSHTLPYPDDRHEVYRLLAMARFLGAEPRGAHLEFPLRPGDYLELDSVPRLADAARGGRALVLHPGAEVEAKRWPTERFGLVGQALVARLGLVPVVTGLASEKKLTAAVASQLGPAAIDTGGRLPLGGLGALLQLARLLVTNDTATAHLAYALGTPSVTVFGPQDPARWGPLDRRGHAVVVHDVDCRPCDHERCPTNHRCLASVSVDDVLASAEDLLKDSRFS